MEEATAVKIGKNEFRCYHCRRVLPKKDGDWFNWNHMQVHLCNACNKATASRPERV